VNLTDSERQELLEAFRIDTGRRALRIGRALEELQRTRGRKVEAVAVLEHEAHALRGAAATVSLESVAALAGELERAAQKWESDNPARERVLVAAAARVRYVTAAFAARQAEPEGGDLVRLPLEGEGPLLLHIEDNVSNLKLIERVLEQRPEIRLAEARTGAAGLALAAELTPDLVLLDLRLPDLPGDEVLRLLRETRAMRETPIVVISAEARPAEADRLLAAGADDFLVKPIDVRMLLTVVDRLLARTKR
jgi:CheY-like chemotaxis protein/HPt (histidine-containing phosphotransfer) domain-containing protein